jgi:CBS domain containing-hemolysin-like protein
VIGFRLALLLVLAGLSIFLAAVEASFHLLKRRRLAQLLRHDEAKEALVEPYLENPPRLLMPVHLGTYTAHVAMTVIIASLFYDLLTHWAMLVAFAAMMAYLLLVRVSVPYLLVAQDPERAFLRLVPAFDVWARALRPVISRLRRRTAADADDEEETGGVVLPELPRPPVQEGDENRLAEALGRFSETPVRDILGVVDVRDLLAPDATADRPLGALARPAHIIPETKHIAELLREMQADRFTFAVAVDEYGGMAGIVTVEDIVEELVGEIQDEFDVELDPLLLEADGAVVVDGRVSVERLEEALEAELAVDEEGIDTVGGLVTSIFGRIPQVGERASHQGFEVEVLDAEEKRVNRARFRRVPVPDPA